MPAPKGAGGRGAWAMRRLRVGQWAALLLALLAFSSQSFVVQTHVHGETRTLVPAHDAGGSAAAHSGRGDAGRARIAGAETPFDWPDDCPLCRELVAAGDYLAAAPASFTPPPPAARWFAAVDPLVAALRQRSHIWRSRAPPILQP